MTCTKRTLMAMYRAMRRRFGDRHWWPGDTQLEVCVGAILTQNTAWTNVERAIAQLKDARALCVRTLRAMPAATLARLIRPAGYFNVKARRLKNFIAAVTGAGGNLAAFLDRPIPQLRAALLAIKGVGPETADSMILYAARKRSFVVDAYTHRILLRHGLWTGRYDYEAIREMFQTLLPSRTKLWNDYHAQLVAVGKDFCKPTARCDRCPLNRFAHDAKLN